MPVCDRTLRAGRSEFARASGPRRPSCLRRKIWSARPGLRCSCHRRRRRRSCRPRFRRLSCKRPSCRPSLQHLPCFPRANCRRAHVTSPVYKIVDAFGSVLQCRHKIGLMFCNLYLQHHGGHTRECCHPNLMGTFRILSCIGSGRFTLFTTNHLISHLRWLYR